jgi:hypothetical protein
MTGKHRSATQEHKKKKYLSKQREWRKVKKELEYKNNPKKWAQDTVNRMCQNNTVSRLAVKNLFDYCSSYQNSNLNNSDYVLVCRLDEWRKDEDGEKCKQLSNYYLEVSELNYMVIKCS